MQGPPSPLLSEAQQSHPPANEEYAERETLTQQSENGGRRRAKRRYNPLDSSNATPLALRTGRQNK